MINAEVLGKLDKTLRPILTSTLPPWLTTYIYSNGRKCFLKSLTSGNISEVIPPEQLKRNLWGLEFRSPIFNAAGMFKGPEGYQAMAAQGAGAFLGGSFSLKERAGNLKKGIWHPFAPYPHSKAASNWMGLPNPGAELIATTLNKIEKVSGCPAGISIVPSDNLSEEEETEDMLKSMELFEAADVDFFEINISCPNTDHRLDEVESLTKKLVEISNRFIKKERGKKIPVIIKLSHDISEEQLNQILELIISLCFDGVNLGNTSTNYELYRKSLSKKDLKLFDWYTSTFGGGFSGKPLKEKSLKLVRVASEYIRNQPPLHEFHIIRTGGIETAEDVKASLDAGASLCQWFSGYFEEFSSQGHNIYNNLYNHLT